MRDSPETITRTALIIFVVMLLTVVVGGTAVIAPSALAVQRLQDELCISLQGLPPVLLQVGRCDRLAYIGG